jgi:hypothetical protein
MRTPLSMTRSSTSIRECVVPGDSMLTIPECNAGCMLRVTLGDDPSVPCLRLLARRAVTLTRSPSRDTRRREGVRSGWDRIVGTSLALTPSVCPS